MDFQGQMFSFSFIKYVDFNFDFFYHDFLFHFNCLLFFFL